MLTKKDFLNKYLIDESDFKKSTLRWSDLKLIDSDFKKQFSNFSPTCKDVAERMRSLESVHSVKYRLKNSEHLLKKIIRKKIENPERVINIKTYKDEITDLIGVRVLHLFKNDWLNIHDFINKTWKLKESPIAYLRDGDSEYFEKEFIKHGCEIKKHNFGYRSVHYILKCQPTKIMHYVEVQVRTIFEEGWSEIDHRVRYPDISNDPILNQLLRIFNGLAGSADEMGSFIKNLKIDLAEKDLRNDQKIDELSKTIEELKRKLQKYKIPKTDLDYINDSLNTINNINAQFAAIPDPLKEQSYIDAINRMKKLEFADFSNILGNIGGLYMQTRYPWLSAPPNVKPKRNHDKKGESTNSENDNDDLKAEDDISKKLPPDNANGQGGADNEETDKSDTDSEKGQ